MHATNTSDQAFWLFMILGGIYLFPTIVAIMRMHHNRFAICALNVLLGWSFIGWVVALVWALLREPPRPAR